MYFLTTFVLLLADIMKTICSFGWLEIRKSNLTAAYGISNRNVKLTSVKHFMLKYIDATLVVTSLRL